MDNQEDLLESVLGSDAFWMVNKKVAYAVGMIAAALLADLVAKRRYFRIRGELDNQGGFFNVASSLESDLVIGEKSLRTAKKKLEEAGFIKLKKRGVPAKHYFYIQDKKIMKCLSASGGQRDTTGSTRKDTTSSSQKDTAINKNKVTKIKNKPGKTKKVLRDDPIIIQLRDLSKKYLKQDIVLSDKECRPLFGIVTLQTMDKIERAFKQAAKEKVTYTFNSIMHKSSNIAMLSSKWKDPVSDKPKKDNSKEQLEEFYAK